MLLPMDCYGDALSERGLNTQPNQKVDTLLLN